MTRKPLTQNVIKNLTGDPIFTVDGDGHIEPTATQNMPRGGTFVIQHLYPNAPEDEKYKGYVCAWRNGTCQCSALVTDLLGESHLEINDTAYTIKSTAALDHYTLYTTTSEVGGNGPIGNVHNGDIHIGT